MAISMEQARTVLAAAKSEAADAEHFTGERLDGGWVFTWSADGDVPLGTTTWVVADNGAVRPLGFRDTPQSALAALGAG
ncbi:MULTISPECIES: hypothetical protein [unclassified Modestobacter]|uniref:hypothetical protein n=1 Tax=unclassified Modestobacter TaxID=2643866 RepID=UPI0022AA9081|nr:MULTISPECIES: hypothetical protein [unclassified Modestobacter]MCZ2826065.1 hypothetical protein [Modestobacter sp. VKM Ac-2981]MCZ2852870.1 hypothetical protein [Modestobacter sp. VKM Ac-2982]